MSLEMSDEHSRLTEEIVERIKSMVFLCMYCNSQNPISASVVEFQDHVSGSVATAFLICDSCRNKFMVKIEDLGQVQK
jgi:transcription elongation factor Elf1